MIIQIVGTSGAGKTYIMRQLLDDARQAGVNVSPVKVPGMEHRALLAGYELTETTPEGCRVFVVGTYEDAVTGGCDSLKPLPISYTYGLIEERALAGWDVVYEGLFVMNMTRGPQLLDNAQTPFHLLYLAVPLASCIASVNTRRAANGQGLLETKKNTTGNFVRANNYSVVMKNAGALVERVSREQALGRVKTLLGVQWPIGTLSAHTHAVSSGRART